MPNQKVGRQRFRRLRDDLGGALDGPAVNVACLMRFKGEAIDYDRYAFDFIANVK